ncbi:MULTISPECIES: siderophore-iron reductase FhuF [unclassified Pseudomonas]|uniref:siderophore-iron reductase FhuF n=1 Tax=unclassified Pseudomonas TaxID=196821 RepID=UPI000D33232D|nr:MULTISPECIES: siderophore-iron reductase FhuF [unclassified Pseudomonas]RAU39500.1 siderophore-iron reductase FhuF [Pseudomonas sp. RIT 409]RAU55120.1 siderophore-iron reductase FhuF [Pseudomonas sp. RIT 412]
MIPALAPLFIADFAHYRDVLVLEHDPRPSMALQTFLTPETFDDVLTRFAAQFPAGDRRGLASVWTKHYFVKLIPPVVAASLILDYRVPVRLDRLQLVLDEHALPVAFKLPDPGTNWAPMPTDTFQRFDDLLEGHLRPFVDGVARLSRVSRNVLWSNAGNYFEWLLGVLAVAMPQADLCHGHGLIAAATLPDGRRNPLHEPVRYLMTAGSSGSRRQRRVCCLRYRVGELTLCDSCPIAALRAQSAVKKGLR